MNLTPAAILALGLAALVGVVALWSDSLLADFWWRGLATLMVVGLVYELYVTRRLDVAGRLPSGRPCSSVAPRGSSCAGERHAPQSHG